MFIWTTGMPVFGLMFFAAAIFYVIYAFLSAFRGHDLDGQNRAGRRNLRHPGGEWSGQAAGWECGRSKCRATNPSHARFCRMCGTRRP